MTDWEKESEYVLPCRWERAKHFCRWARRHPRKAARAMWAACASTLLYWVMDYLLCTWSREKLEDPGPGDGLGGLVALVERAGPVGRCLLEYPLLVYGAVLGGWMLYFITVGRHTGRFDARVDRASKKWMFF